MARIELRTDPQILEEMVNRVVARTSLSDVTDASSILQLLRAVAAQLGEAYFQMSLVGLLNDSTQAKGSDLDAFAARVIPGRLRRRGSRQAVGLQVFSRPSNDGTTRYVPVGTVMKRADGTRYRTLAQAVVTSTSPEQVAGHGVGRDTAPVPAVAVAPGAQSNTGTDTVNQLTARPAGFTETTNVRAFVGGRGLESDEEFLARIDDYVQSLSRCTVDALEALVLGLQDTASGKEVFFARAIEHPEDRGRVTLYVDDGSGTAETTVDAAPTGTVVLYDDATGGIFTVVSALPVIRGDLVGRQVELIDDSNLTPTPGANEGTFVVTAVLTDSSFQVDTLGAGSLLSPAPTRFVFGPEVVLEDSLGGEEFLRLDGRPVQDRLPVEVSTVPTGGGTPRVLTRDVDYRLDPASGLLYFTKPLVVGIDVQARYSYFTGLIALVQRTVDGDPNDRENFPGLRAAGISVQVKSPRVRVITVDVGLTVSDGFDRSLVQSNVRGVIEEYINNLSVSADVVRNELIERIMSVPGVFDIDLQAPVSNVNILDDQVARVTAASVQVS